MQGQEEENICKLPSSPLQRNKPELPRPYLGRVQASPEPPNKERGRLRKADMLGLYLYLTSGYFKGKAGNHG